jgi:hypothetical protein
MREIGDNVGQGGVQEQSRESFDETGSGEKRNSGTRGHPMGHIAEGVIMREMRNKVGQVGVHYHARDISPKRH